MQKYDTSKELLIQPYKKGVKLVRPDKNLQGLPSIAEIFQLPVLGYIVDRDSVFIDANHLTLITNLPDNRGYASSTDLIGKDPFKLFTEESAAGLAQANNKIYFEKPEMSIFEETVHRLDYYSFIGLSFKFPLYNDTNEIMGIFGVSAVASGLAEAVPVSTALESIINTGLLPQTNKGISYRHLLPGSEIDGAYLSAQESKCLRLLVSGKTVKMIGQSMNLSPRTVEHYLENIKNKLNVRSKPELIEKVVHCLWPDIFCK